jgi:hypothetical protein
MVSRELTIRPRSDHLRLRAEVVDGRLEVLLQQLLDLGEGPLLGHAGM